MKYNLLIIFLCSFSFSLFAQPDNDDCIGIIDFGDLPYCPTVGPDVIHTNVDATASDIGFGNLPSCFNAASERDVWFSFTATADLIDIRITLTGTDMGPNGMPITNPEIALYRGECAFDGLAELACISAAPGETTLILDVLGLTPDVMYFIRVNDYSETATPNWGDFSFCIDEISEFLCGDIEAATGCSGTFFDSGGADEDYSDGEDCVFTICPSDPHACITLDVISLNLENNFDFLTVYAGATINSPEIASLTGVSTGDGFDIQASSDCVTLQFTSDGSGTSAGFEIAWQCSPLACDGTSIDDPIVIGSIPYNGDHSTCDDAATFNTSPCTQAPFLNGAETVFIYDSPGGLCASIELVGAEAGTGILVMDGPPDDPATVCYGQNGAGLLQNVNFEEPGEYYIVVANATECTDYTLVIEEADCALSPALADALCNPLNGCIEDGGVPSIFFFEDGFQDIANTVGTNNGCWFGVGFEPDYYWFTIEAQADGPFGFILESANIPSDIDFNVWGPFDPETVCETPGEIINFITNNQPIRSSYAGGTEPTGLADVHPTGGYDIEDVYDCDGNNDDIVMTIAAQEGEVYVVLANDWGNQIQGGGIQVDWSPSEASVLAPVAVQLAIGDTAICSGQTVQLLLEGGVESIQWIGDNVDELSCEFCADPIASPDETTMYRAVVSAVCYVDTIQVEVQVLDLEAGPDVEVCLGEQFEIPAGEDFQNATYAWTPPAGLEFSCIDCPAPLVTAMVAGSYQVPVTLTAEFCDFEDFVTINVLPAQAAAYEISDDSQICNGESISIGGDPSANVTYEWISAPSGDPLAPVSNPEVSPTSTTTYYLTAMNDECPTPSVDSVTISVVNLPIAEILETPDTLCLGDTISLSNIMVEDGVGYSWVGPTEILHPDSNYTQIVPQVSGIYTITADRGGCQVTDDIEVNVVNINIDLQQPDEVLICLGEAVNLNALVTPSDLNISWDPDDLVGPDHVLTPETYTEYTATVQIGSCIRQDMFAIQVDSLPSDMSIVVNPDESSYCQGELVTLISPTYDPANFPFMTHEWESIGGETADSLYNFVLTTVDTFTYIRTTVNGACSQMDSVTLNVITLDDLFVQTPDENCPGAEVQLLLEGGATGEITWEDPSGTLSCTDCLDPIATPTQTTTYTVTSDIEGCEIDPIMVTVTVAEYEPLDLIQGQEGCQSDSPSFSLNNTPQQPGTTYTWTGPGFSSNEAQPMVSPTSTTTYTVTAVNDCGTETGEVTVSIIEPATLIAGDDVTICLDNEFNLTSTATGGGGAAENFTWIYDGENNVGNNTSFTATTSGYAYINYTYGPSPDGCETLVDSVFIDVLDATYSVDIEIDPTDLMDVYQGTPFDLNAVITSTGNYDYSFQWSAEEGSTFTTPTEQSTGVVASLTHVGDETYTVLVSIPEGCVEEASITLEILEAEFEIPNVFSPNRDNINEVFGLYAGGGVEEYSCKIFNRWGQLVFETSELSEFWDGTYNDEDAPSDVYIYLMNFRVGGVNYEEKGDVTLVR